MLNVTVAKIRESMAMGITFDPAIDLRKDLVMFHGFEMEKVISMTDDEVYNFFDILEYGEEDEDKAIYPVKCNNCGHQGMECIGYDDSADIKNHYKMICPDCKTTSHIHECAMDSILEEEEFNKQICEEIRQLTKQGGKWRYHRFYDKKDFNLESYTKGWDLVQQIELEELTTYYFKNMSIYMEVEKDIHGYKVCMLTLETV